MPRYNVVLIPTTPKDKDFFTKFSIRHFSSLTAGYLLGKISLPHITICQFELEDAAEVLDIASKIEAIVKPTYILELPGFSTVSLSGQFEGQQAVEFNITKTDELRTLHYRIVKLIEDEGLSPLNAARELYRPHLTLAMLDKKKIGKSHSYLPSEVPPELATLRPFQIAVGQADENWQFTQSFWTASEGFRVPLHKTIKPSCSTTTTRTDEQTYARYSPSFSLRPLPPVSSSTPSRLPCKDSNLAVAAPKTRESDTIAVSLVLTVCVVALLLPLTRAIAKALFVKPKPGRRVTFLPDAKADQPQTRSNHTHRI